MRLVTRRTGLTSHVIRAWERRYSAVTPARTGTNRRLYSDDDIERLELLRRATEAGHSISRIARLSAAELRELVPTPAVATGVPTGLGASANAEGFFSAAIEAVLEMNAELLEMVLMRACAGLAVPVLIEGLIAPFLGEVGELWRLGRIRAAHEHLASAVVRTLLGNLKDSFRPAQRAPRVLVTTPSAQWHELGALLATVTAASAGWRAIYLGSNLPAQEIAGAANHRQVRAVALSIVYPPDDPLLGNELRQLRRLLSSDIALVAGGRAAPEYARELESVGAHLVGDTHSFRSVLDRLLLKVDDPLTPLPREAPPGA